MNMHGTCNKKLTSITAWVKLFGELPIVSPWHRHDSASSY